MTTTFETPPKKIQDLLTSVAAGKVQLPDFQRDWIWDDDHVRRLLASVSLSYPIGSLMLLQLGGPDMRFKSRLLSGVFLNPLPDPEFLVLDGQQRLTALFQAVFSTNPVDTKNTKGKRIKRWYYLDIRRCLDQRIDREEAIVSIPENRIVTDFRGNLLGDYSSKEKEYSHELFPVRILFDQPQLTRWSMEYMQQTGADLGERVQRWNDFMTRVGTPMQSYLIPLIVLTKETPREAVCQVFERVNTGGVALSVFELLTATYAADNFNLQEDWKQRLQVLHPHKVLAKLKNTEFLQAVALMVAWRKREEALRTNPAPAVAPNVSCRGKDILRLTSAEYKSVASLAAAGFVRAAKFLHALRIFDDRNLPYKSQIIPLAVILALLGDRGDADGVKSKLAKWFWCGIFGELYGGSVDSKVARDVLEVLEWIDGGQEPAVINDANFKKTRLKTLRSRTSTAYKGIYALLMKDGALDFLTGESFELRHYFDEKTDIHHIFPQKWCKDHGLSKEEYDCILNKTPITAQTNKIIGSKAPSKYLKLIQTKAGIDAARLKQILESHSIASDKLQIDDFRAFLESREQQILSKIADAMGKPIVDDIDVSDEEIEADDLLSETEDVDPEIEDSCDAEDDELEETVGAPR